MQKHTPGVQEFPLAQKQFNLQQAVRTLRAIRERYEMGRTVHPNYVRAYTVQVALGYTDMLWITAAIESIEQAMGSATEVARFAAPARAEM